MKKITTLLFFLSLAINAQEKKQDFFKFRYVGFALEEGNNVGTSIDLNYIYKNKISLSFGCVEGFYTPENPPTDYNTQEAYLYGDHSTHVYFAVGKIIKIKRFKKTRLNLSTGLAYTKHYVNDNFVKSNQYSNEYSFDVKTQNDLSLVLNPKLEIPLLSWVGFQLSPKVVLNKKKSFYGLGFGLMLGKLYPSSFRVKAQENKGNNSIIKEVGQEKKQSNLGLVYVTGAIEVGNYIGLNADLNYIYKENISFSLGRMGNWYTDENYPEDEPSSGCFLCDIGDSSNVYLTVGKIIKIKDIYNLRFNLAGGLAISKYYDSESYEKATSKNGVESHVGLVINPKMEVLFSRWIGVQISPKVILNTRQSFYGLGLGLMLGKVSN